MHLRCHLPHMAHQTLLIEGVEYHLDGDGVCQGLSRDHAERLLSQGDVWTVVGGSTLPKPRADEVAFLELPEDLEISVPDGVQSLPVGKRKRGRPRKEALV